MDSSQQKIRLDKWLWAARFFKTRALATEAINGGKVHLNSGRIKPSRPVHVGDTLQVRQGVDEKTIIVLALTDRRGPASEAQKLYEETEDSRLKREQAAAQRKLEYAGRPRGTGRPSKRERRHIIRFVKRDE